MRAFLASTNAYEPSGAWPCLGAFAWTLAPAPVWGANVPEGDCGQPLTRTCASLAPVKVQPLVCGGRYEGTEIFLGRRELYERSLGAPSQWRETLKKCLV